MRAFKLGAAPCSPRRLFAAPRPVEGRHRARRCNGAQVEPVTPWEADVNARIQYCMKHGLEGALLHQGDAVVVVHGWKSGGHSTNTVRVLNVP